MSPLSIRRNENWKFAHAAEAMGAFWAHARKVEARRKRTTRRSPLAGTSPSAAAAAASRAAAEMTAALLVR